MNICCWPHIYIFILENPYYRKIHPINLDVLPYGVFIFFKELLVYFFRNNRHFSLYIDVILIDKTPTHHFLFLNFIQKWIVPIDSVITRQKISNHHGLITTPGYHQFNTLNVVLYLIDMRELKTYTLPFLKTLKGEAGTLTPNKNTVSSKITENSIK